MSELYSRTTARALEYVASEIREQCTVVVRIDERFKKHVSALALLSLYGPVRISRQR